MITARLWDMAQRIARRPPDFIIGEPEDPYMHRWWVIPRNRLFNIYLHHFLKSDYDEALHDHPWWNASWLLDGEYTEHTISAGGIHHKVKYVAGQRRLRTARQAHRVELHAGPCWSLFFTGPVIRRWGFHCESGWRYWKEFVSQHDGGNQTGKGCA